MKSVVSFLVGMALVAAATLPRIKNWAVKTVSHAPAIKTLVVSKTMISADKGKTMVLGWMNRCGRLPFGMAERIYAEAHKHRFPDLLIAMAEVESHFNPDAISSKGAIGLMQITGEVWTEKLKQQGIIRGEADLFNISKSMDACSYILARYIKYERGNLEDALLQYGGLDRSYPEKVMAALGEIEAVKEVN